MIQEDEFLYKVKGCVYEVHKVLGPGLLESVYEKALVLELKNNGFIVERQVSVPIIYKGVDLDSELRIDLLVDKRLIIELKSVEELHPIHFKQLNTYLILLNKYKGLLVNFNAEFLDGNSCRIVYNKYASNKNIYIGDL